MKTLTLTLIAVIVVAMTSCEKEEVQPSEPGSKDKKIECKKCEEGWDITDQGE